jgi:hypothetical protein
MVPKEYNWKKEYNWLLKNPKIERKYAGEYIAIIGEAVVPMAKISKKYSRKQKVPSSDKELAV